MLSAPRIHHKRLKPITAKTSGYPNSAGINAEMEFQTATMPSQIDLFYQIDQAFKKSPNVARIFHGDRRICQGGRGRRTALFPSRKCGGHVPLESQLELAYAVVLERSPLVRDYRTQAIRIPLPGGRSAHPDFLIRTVDGTFEIHEVKPSIEYLSAEAIQRFATIGELLARTGIGFKVVDASDLCSGVELQKLLGQYSRGHIQAISQQQIDLGTTILRDGNINSFSEAYKLLREQQLPVQLADYLHFHQQWAFRSAKGLPNDQNY